MDREIREIIGRHGYMVVHRTFQDIMKQDYEYLKSVFEPTPLDSIHTIKIENQTSDTPAKRGRKPKAQQLQSTEQVPRHSPVTGGEVKTISIQPEAENELHSLTTFIPHLIEKTDGDSQPPISAFKDPKEQKVWQMEEENKKHVENESLGIKIHEVLTKENLKQWIEEEGKTYAWVAREKAGCPSSQVAATAQMMGIQSKITKKRGILMGRH